MIMTFHLVTVTMPKRNKLFICRYGSGILEAIKSEYVDKKVGFKVADLHF